MIFFNYNRLADLFKGAEARQAAVCLNRLTQKNRRKKVKFVSLDSGRQSALESEELLKKFSKSYMKL